MRLEEFPTDFIRDYPTAAESILTNRLRSTGLEPSPIIVNSIPVQSGVYDWLCTRECLLPFYGGLYIPTFRKGRKPINTCTIFDEDNGKREFSFAPKRIIYGFVKDLEDQESCENRYLQTFVKPDLHLYNLLRIGQKNFKNDAFYTLFVRQKS